MVGNFINTQIDNLNKLRLENKWQIDFKDFVVNSLCFCSSKFKIVFLIILISLLETERLGGGEFGEVYVAHVFRTNKKVTSSPNDTKPLSKIAVKTHKGSRRVVEETKLLNFTAEEKEKTEKVAAKEAKGNNQSINLYQYVNFIFFKSDIYRQ